MFFHGPTHRWAYYKAKAGTGMLGGKSGLDCITRETERSFVPKSQQPQAGIAGVQRDNCRVEGVRKMMGREGRKPVANRTLLTSP